MRSKQETLVSTVLIASMVAIAGSVLFRTFRAPVSVAREVARPTTPELIPYWTEARRAGLLMGGDSAAPVVILTLTDFECPICKGIHEVLKELLHTFPRDVQLQYAAYPLEYHRFAWPASRAAECAADVGAFAEWASAIFAKQDSLGLRTWAAYARDAGVTDTLAMQACAIDPRPSEWIERGRALGARLELQGVPLVMVNGWRFHHTPSKQELETAVRSLLAGKTPG